MPLTFSPVCQAERLSLSGPLITFLFSYLLLQRTDEDVNVAVCNYISYIGNWYHGWYLITESFLAKGTSLAAFYKDRPMIFLARANQEMTQRRKFSTDWLSLNWPNENQRSNMGISQIKPYWKQTTALNLLIASIWIFSITTWFCRNRRDTQFPTPRGLSPWKDPIWGKSPRI